MVNYGGVAYFIGGEGNNFKFTPRQYTALPNAVYKIKEMKFTFKDGNIDLKSTFLYWRDADLNTYKMKIGINKCEYFIDDVPKVKRSPKFYTMSWRWLDWVFSYIFEKDWFTDYEVPSDENLIITNYLTKHLCG